MSESVGRTGAPPAQRFTSEHQVSLLVSGFESGLLPRGRWTHAAHLAVVTWYLRRYPESDATERMIAGIQRYNRASGSDGYHETITLFWLALVRRFLQGIEDASVLEAINGVIAEFGHNPCLILEYYSRDRINSLQARQTWVDPDRKSLDE